MAAYGQNEQFQWLFCYIPKFCPCHRLHKIECDTESEECGMKQLRTILQHDLHFYLMGPRNTMQNQSVQLVSLLRFESGTPEYEAQLLRYESVSVRIP
jgi:hypothetical protein